MDSNDKDNRVIPLHERKQISSYVIKIKRELTLIEINYSSPFLWIKSLTQKWKIVKIYSNQKRAHIIKLDTDANWINYNSLGLLNPVHLGTSVDIWFILETFFMGYRLSIFDTILLPFWNTQLLTEIITVFFCYWQHNNRIWLQIYLKHKFQTICTHL